MKIYEVPKIEICTEHSDVITSSNPDTIDRGYDMPAIPMILY